MKIEGIYAEYWKTENWEMFKELSTNIIDNVLQNIEFNTEIDSIKFDDILSDAIWQEIDRYCIYYANQWEVLRTYCTPQNADFNRAIDELINDLYTIIKIEEC